MSASHTDMILLAPTDSARERETTCAVCGQRFDLDDLAETFHHTSDRHAPLPDRD